MKNILYKIGWVNKSGHVDYYEVFVDLSVFVLFALVLSAIYIVRGV